MTPERRAAVVEWLRTFAHNTRLAGHLFPAEMCADAAADIEALAKAQDEHNRKIDP